MAGVSANPAAQFQPGISDSPGGRTKRKPILEALQRNITDADLDVMARAQVKKLRRGDLFALTFVRDTLKPSRLGPWRSAAPTAVTSISGPHAGTQKAIRGS